MANKKRLIDANEFEEAHCKGCPYRLEESCTNDDPICAMIADLRDAPTVDAVEVVHGRWVKCKDWDYDYECSVCEGYAGEDVDGNYNKLTPYCPNCGAKMDGDGNG